MIKATFSHNGMNIDLECSNPSELVDVVKGVFNKAETKKNLEVSGATSHSARAKFSRRGGRGAWSENDTVAIGRLVIENRNNLKGIARKVNSYLNLHGDVTNRNMTTTFSKVIEVKNYLIKGSTSGVPKRTIDILQRNNIYPSGSRRVIITTPQEA